ncbi:hypothetical protein [Sphingobacterium composti Ten et al. 2007 non Yoo et al. 2007]|uniref:hypothetical protein n=1 Tax=Sphingobacterium composti TaxID=363260 RepID=UPI00135A750A|nr:hypothetical protein [Sphingobacterium composti Ten et al. 2007 non Yoo et al. 2007]
MILGRQVNSLLQRHSAVFVIGLGTFRRIRTSASYDAKRNVVLPPLSYIEFEHDASDGYDFSLYVQQSNQIEKSEAELLLQKEVDKLIDIIHTDGQATIDELGYLVAYGNSFIFKPLDLSGFQFVPIEDPYQNPVGDDNEASAISDESSPIAAVTGIANAVEQESAQSTTVEEPVYSFPHAGQPHDLFEEESPKRNNAIVYVLLAVVALVALGGIYYYSIISKKLDNVDQYLNSIDSVDIEADTLTNLVDSNALLPLDSLVSNEADSLLLVEQKVEKPIVEEPVLHKYTIVIGTHPKLEQAQQEAADYNKKGFKHVRALPSNLEKNRKKVIWDTYPTKELRDSALRYVQKNVKSDAWPTVL